MASSPMASPPALRSSAADGKRSSGIPAERSSGIASPPAVFQRVRCPAASPPSPSGKPLARLSGSLCAICIVFYGKPWARPAFRYRKSSHNLEGFGLAEQQGCILFIKNSRFSYIVHGTKTEQKACCCRLEQFSCLFCDICSQFFLYFPVSPYFPILG
jgi:hypothetical protein